MKSKICLITVQEGREKWNVKSNIRNNSNFLEWKKYL